VVALGLLVKNIRQFLTGLEKQTCALQTLENSSCVYQMKSFTFWNCGDTFSLILTPGTRLG